MIERKQTNEMHIGNVVIGNHRPIAIQSMTNTDTRDIVATVAQIRELAEAGCEIVRVAVPDREAAEALKMIKKSCPIPLVADIHFDYRLGVRAIENGVDKLRINPGNIGDEEKVKKVVALAKERAVPIRIGINAGSLEKDIVEKNKGVTPAGMVESAMRHIAILEALDYQNIAISLKASSVVFTLEAYERIAALVPYPLHVGITETGTVYAGGIKSAVGIGSILSRGIGDTIRVSLTGDPVEEVRCAKEILRALGLRTFGVECISCPTCGRTEIDLISIAKAVEERVKNVKANIKVAVMGCVVNGPGEAREADFGIAGGKGCGIVFKNGKIIEKVEESDLVDALMRAIENE